MASAPGTFIRTKNGWRAQVFLGRDEAGRSKFVTQSFPTKKEAEDWATETKVGVNKGTLRPTLSKSTLASFLRDSWLPMYATQVRSTYTPEKVLGKWIIDATPALGVPLLGPVQLRKLTPAHFTKLYLALHKQGALQDRGIRHLHGLLHRALKYAMKEGQLPSNPAAFATLPKADVRAEITSAEDEDESKIEYLTKEQATRFVAALATLRESAWQEHKRAVAEGRKPVAST